MKNEENLPGDLAAPEIKQQPQKPRLKKRALIAVIIVAVILIVAALSVYFLTPEQKRVTIYDVSDIRELEVLRDVPQDYMSREDLKDYVIESMRDADSEKMENARRFLDSLFLLDYEENLTRILIDAYSSQIAGFYDHKNGKIMVIEGYNTVLDRVILAHEYTHALQDQHFDLQAFMNVTDWDAGMAREAVFEGDASLVQSFYMYSLSSEEMTQLLKEVEESQETAEALPYAIRQILSFPYLEGLIFIQGLYYDGGWDSVNDAYHDPPASTEQIMHIDKYRAREVPVSVVFDDEVPNMTLVFDDTIGEFTIKQMLDNYISTDWAASAAEGWGGDRFYFYENETDFLSVFKIEWDSVSDAVEFDSAYETWMTLLPYKYGDVVSGNRLQIKQSQNVTTICYSSSEDIINDVLN